MGVVDIRDVLLFDQCISGKKYIDDFSQLDADRNSIINRADSLCIMAKITGSSYKSRIEKAPTSLGYFQSGNAASFSLIPTSKSTSYVRYIYASETETTYPLSLTEYNSTAGEEAEIQSSNVFGIDSRSYMTDQPEFTGIVNIVCGIKNTDGTQSTKNACSTGFIVGDHQIATAAHCVYGEYADSSSEDTAKDFFNFNAAYTGIFLYDDDGVRTNISLTPVAVHIPETYKTKMDETENKYTSTVGVNGTDYALITVAQDLSQYTHFSLGLIDDPYSATFQGDKIIYVSGVPTVFNGKLNEKIVKSNDTLSYEALVYPDQMLYYMTDISGGQSGGPVYSIVKYTINDKPYCDYTALGIVCGSTPIRNEGVRITPMLQKFYLDNGYASLNNSDTVTETE